MFNFKLESALNYRKTLEEKKLVEYFEERKKLKKAKDQLAGIQKELFAIIEQLRNIQEKPFSASEIALYLSYIKLYQEKKSFQRDNIKKINQKVKILREALLEAVKNRKIIDNLKDHQFREFNEKVAANERKVLDETAVLGYIRNNK